MQHKIYDLIIIGGGPCGLAAGIEAQKAGLSYLIIEKGSITESIRRYPIFMTFFSTAENIEIGNIPLPISGAKPTRIEALQYYRRVVEYFGLPLQLFTTINKVEKRGEIFELFTQNREKFTAKNVVIATGYFDCPRNLGISGEGLPHVSKYYDEPFKYAHRKVVIVGGGNSAVETALDLYRHGAEVTMLIRAQDFKPSAKYWLIPDLKNRVKEGKVKVLFDTEIRRIERGKIWYQTLAENEEQMMPADFVLLMIGYTSDTYFLKNCGVQINEEDWVPSFNPQTMETNVAGLYLAGTVVAGTYTEKIFIENGRFDGQKIIRHILRLDSETSGDNQPLFINLEEN
jgi:thioredoxin reductase (NADPH)